MTTTKPTPAMADIYAALLAAGADWPAIQRDATGQIGQNRKYLYATLDTVLDAVQPVLRRHGILLIQNIGRLARPDDETLVLGLLTTLRHVASKSEISSSVPLPEPEGSWQAWGSAVTYARRYALLPLLGLAPEDDDDAAAAQAARPAARAAPARTAPSGTAPAANLGTCTEHGVDYFQTANMRSPAHRTDDGGWCNKPGATDTGAPPAASRVAPLRKATFDRLRAIEQNNALWPDLVGQYAPLLAGKAVRDWTPADLKTINDALKAAEAPDYAAEDAEADARAEAAQW